jgi:hypothetical protein
MKDKLAKTIIDMSNKIESRIQKDLNEFVENIL